MAYTVCCHTNEERVIKPESGEGPDIPKKGWVDLSGELEGYEAIVGDRLILRKKGKLYPCIERLGYYMINGRKVRTKDLRKMAGVEKPTKQLYVKYNGKTYYVGKVSTSDDLAKIRREFREELARKERENI